MIKKIQYAISLAFHFRFRELLIEPTNDAVLQAVRYLFVGGISTIIDWITLFGLDLLNLNKYLATAAGFTFGLLVNYLLSTCLIFKIAKSRVGTGAKEFLGHAFIGIVGLGLTELIIFLLTDIGAINLMLAKIISIAITLVWNFTGRKFILYKA